MPQRFANLFIAVVGVITVLGIALLGFDARRSARTGPRWKRRLVTAGLMLLSMTGLSARDAQGAPAEAVETQAVVVPAEALELTDTQEWKTITEAWAAAAPLAKSGKSTEAQRKAVNEQLAKAVEAAKALAAQNALTEAEAGLLESEAARLKSDIHRTPPSDCQVMCYRMIRLVPARASLSRLTARLPLLEKIAERGTVHDKVLSKILPSLEADVATLSSDKDLKELTDEERTEAIKLRDAAKAHLQTIRKSIGDEK